MYLHASCNITDQPIAKNGNVYVVVVKGMYGFKQAGKLANELLQHNLGEHGYYPVLLTLE